MAFRSWRSFKDFEKKTKFDQRYIHDDEIDEFLKEVLRTTADRTSKLEKKNICLRAQLGFEWETKMLVEGESYEEPSPLSVKRMFPQKLKAMEGRANPKGIPFLYLSNNKETAMSEVRPWLGSYISLGHFKLKRDLSLVNCSIDKKITAYYFEEPDDKTKENKVWSDIADAFSKPVLQGDDTADYIPTQIIAELFRSNGYDGIVYKSMLAEGYNIALFDIEAADLIKCNLFEAEKVKFAFKESGNPYFIKQVDK